MGVFGHMGGIQMYGIHMPPKYDAPMPASKVGYPL